MQNFSFFSRVLKSDNLEGRFKRAFLEFFHTFESFEPWNIYDYWVINQIKYASKISRDKVK